MTNLPVGSVTIEVFVQIDEAAGDFDRITFGFIQAVQQPAVEVPNLLNVAEENFQFVHLEAGSFLPVFQVTVMQAQLGSYIFF